MKKISLFIFLVFTFSGSYACLNGDSKVLKDGTFFYMDDNGRVPYGHIFSSEGLQDNVARLDSIYQKTKDLDYLSDKGLVLIVMGQYNEAINLYLKIEQIEPNRYSTASNIGTAYELAGQNERALYWIKRAVEINPASHMNSEWLHAKILEAKIGGVKFYNTHFLLNTTFGEDVRPVSKMTYRDLEKLSDALYYQLNERVSFVKPKEKIVAQLFFDLGNVAFLMGHYSDAVLDYKEAQKYGFKGALILKRIEESGKLALQQPKQRKRTVIAQPQYTMGLIAGILLLIMAVIIIVKRRRNKS